jgi:outer membrane protein assembly factor BamD (BamD/ComL family)
MSNAPSELRPSTHKVRSINSLMKVVEIFPNSWNHTYLELKLNKLKGRILPKNRAL